MKRIIEALIRRSPVSTASFAVLVVILHAFIVCQKPPATLTIEMRSSVASRSHAFFDTGNGFNEAESEERLVLGGVDWHTLYFPFPARTVHAIRFVPLHVSGEFEIRSIVIERSDSHQVIRKLDVSRISRLNQSASTSRESEEASSPPDEANDSELLLPVDSPITAGYSAAQIFLPRILILDALLLIGAVMVLAATRYEYRPLSSILRGLDAFSERLSRPGLFHVDRAALLFYAICLLTFVVLSLARVHGSSISIAGASYNEWTDVVHTPLLGNPKRIRSDEWAFHTPAILNQVLREETLSINDASVGPGKAALLANVPCRHFTQLFRPQFWSFFILPVDFAFSVYWQAKALLLLTGVFTLLLLLTRSSGISAIGSLWYFFSAYTQWAYSWASLLPEMVGLFGWVIFLSCYLLVGQNKTRLLIAALLCANCAVNFALCAYPPHQIPLIVVGVAVLAWWLWSHRRLIWGRELLLTRVLILAGCWAIVGAAMFWFYLDAKETLLAAANTVYPGHRLNSGGGISVAQLLSHFLDFWKTEKSFPPLHRNICESSGYLLLAPLTLLVRVAAESPRQSNSLRICLWTAFVFILAWVLIPIPARVGHWVSFDRIPSNDCWHALGLTH